MTTREFVIADYDAAVVLWKNAEGIDVSEGDSCQELREYFARNPGLSRVAEEDGSLVGAVLCGHDGRRGWIYHLAVAPAFRGRGLGRQLLDECLEGLRRAQIKRALILADRENSLGEQFWRRNGWEELSFAMPMAKDV